MIVKLIMILSLFFKINMCLSNDSITVGSGNPGMNLKKAIYESYSGKKIVVSLDKEKIGQLKEVYFEIDNKKIYVDNEEIKNICSVDLFNIEIYQIIKAGGAVSDDFYVIIPFYEYIKNCIYPENDADLPPFFEQKLIITVVNNEISKVDIE